MRGLLRFLNSRQSLPAQIEVMSSDSISPGLMVCRGMMSVMESIILLLSRLGIIILLCRIEILHLGMNHAIIKDISLILAIVRIMRRILNAERYEEYYLLFIVFCRIALG